MSASLTGGFASASSLRSFRKQQWRSNVRSARWRRHGRTARGGDPEQERPAMIAPPAAERSERYHGWWAAFTFEEDGKWHCVQFTRF